MYNNLAYLFEFSKWKYNPSYTVYVSVHLNIPRKPSHKGSAGLNMREKKRLARPNIHSQWKAEYIASIRTILPSLWIKNDGVWLAWLRIQISV